MLLLKHSEKKIDYVIKMNVPTYLLNVIFKGVLLVLLKQNALCVEIYNGMNYLLSFEGFTSISF
jgi:hypothetical protein